MKNNINKKLQFFVLLIWAPILWSGCAIFNSQNALDSPKNETGSTVPAEGAYRFTDIPVPTNFKLDRKKSFIYQSGLIKAGILTYSGWSKLETIIDFYKEEMPNLDWEIINTFEHNSVIMHYRKDGWNCVIKLDSKKLGGSKIEIQIGPINKL